MFLGFGRFRIQADVVLFLDGQAELQRINRIQPQAFAEQGGCALYVSRLDVFQLQARDD